jgi:dihydroorotate dehydrogenase
LQKKQEKVDKLTEELHYQANLVPMYVKISPEVKQLVENQAKIERRTLASMVEVLLRDGCEAKRA